MPELNITIPSHLLLNSTDACCISINIDPPPEKGDLTNCCPVTAALCTHDCDTCILMSAVLSAMNLADAPHDRGRCDE